jgi:membrane-bound metal-dependent hydrolase YbcI (DUF457 family)
VDNVTHTLVGLTLARTPLSRVGPGTTAVLVLASNAPDLDAVVLARGGASAYVHWHRGPTHGLIGVIGLGVLTAGTVWVALRTRSADRDRGAASFPALCALSMLGALVHVLMDIPTSYGTRLLSPFDWRWFGEDWLPIVDVYLLAALLATLLFGRSSAEAGRRNAAIALLFLAANYGVRGVAHSRALRAADWVFGPTLPARCTRTAEDRWIESWPRPGDRAAGGEGRCLVDLAAMPTFVSPFRWRLVARTMNAYELREIDLLDPRYLAAAEDHPAVQRTTVRYPNAWTPPVIASTRAASAQIFLGFSRFPAPRAITGPDGVTIVRWMDVRFAGGLVALQPAARARPFTATVRVGKDNQILGEEMGR